MTALHMVVPDGIDDPARPSGGNTYDRRVRRELGAIGLAVNMHAVPGSWPEPAAAATAALAAAIRSIPNGAVVLVDGLVGSAAAPVLVAQAARLRLVALVHMPLGQGGAGRQVRRREAELLRACAAVVATSAWTRRFLIAEYALARERVHVAEPGVERAALAPGTPAGTELVCVAAVTPVKGHDLLIDALAAIVDVPWSCRCVGSLDRDRDFAAGIHRRIADAGLAGRVQLVGPVGEAELERIYAAADLLVLPSRAETYGMVITEGLAHGLPAVAADVGGVAEALSGSNGDRPGLLVPPGDAAGLATALRAWLADVRLREQLRRAARERRTSLCGWPATASMIAGVAAKVSA